MKTNGTWRELDSSAVERSYGLCWLEITVRRRAGVYRATAEARYRLHRTRYLIERHAPGVVTLVTAGDPAAGGSQRYEVTPHACSCPHAQNGPRGLVCKHRAACLKHRLFSGFSAGETQC